VAILGGNQINNFYSKKTNPISRLKANGRDNIPKEEA
tara:strand:+ start:443 stop:553 length:111 start_codon:yes stop_codon:yes gene_type:complete